MLVSMFVAASSTVSGETPKSCQSGWEEDHLRDDAGDERQRPKHSIPAQPSRSQTLHGTQNTPSPKHKVALSVRIVS